MVLTNLSELVHASFRRHCSASQACQIVTNYHESSPTPYVPFLGVGLIVNSRSLLRFIALLLRSFLMLMLSASVSIPGPGRTPRPKIDPATELVSAAPVPRPVDLRDLTDHARSEGAPERPERGVAAAVNRDDGAVLALCPW